MRQHADVAGHGEGVVELARGLGVAVLDVADLAVDADVEAGQRVSGVPLRGLAAVGVEERRVRVDDGGGEVEHAADGDGVAEGAGVGGDEGRAGVRERGGAAEGQLEGLLEVEAAEDHGLMAVAVLRLHDARRRQHRPGHGDHVGGLALLLGRVVVGELAQPDLVDQGRLGVVGLRLEEGRLERLALRERLLLAGLEQGLLLGRLADQPRHVDGPLRGGVQGDHGEGAGQQDVLGPARLPLVRRPRDLAGDLHAAPARGVGDLAAVLEVADLGERVRDGDAVQRGGDGGEARAGVLVDDDARQGIQVHEDGAQPTQENKKHPVSPHHRRWTSTST